MGHRSACAAALMLLTFANLGRAEPAKHASAAPPLVDPRGYTYQFTDDPLAAGGFDAHDARIVVAKPRGPHDAHSTSHDVRA